MSKFAFPVFVLSILFFVNSCDNTIMNEVNVIEIDSDWEFAQEGKDNWLPAIVPGSVHSDLLANEKIEDPFYRLNEHSLQWIDKEDWIYRTTFKVENNVLNKNNIELYFISI